MPFATSQELFRFLWWLSFFGVLCFLSLLCFLFFTFHFQHWSVIFRVFLHALFQ